MFIILAYPQQRLSAQENLDTSKIITLINNLRSQKNLPLLKNNFHLTKTAKARINDMNTNNYFSHQNNKGQNLKFFLSSSGYKYKQVGEVMAANYISEDDLVTAWLKSASHYKILMNKNYQDIGIYDGDIDIDKENNHIITLIIGEKARQ